MTKETQSTTFQPLLRRLTLLAWCKRRRAKRQRCAAGRERADHRSGCGRNSRIMGILNCEEAHGREEQAACWQKPPV